MRDFIGMTCYMAALLFSALAGFAYHDGQIELYTIFMIMITVSVIVGHHLTDESDWN